MASSRTQYRPTQGTPGAQTTNKETDAGCCYIVAGSRDKPPPSLSVLPQTGSISFVGPGMKVNPDSGLLQGNRRVAEAQTLLAWEAQTLLWFSVCDGFSNKGVGDRFDRANGPSLEPRLCSS